MAVVDQLLSVRQVEDRLARTEDPRHAPCSARSPSTSAPKRRAISTG